MAEFNSPEAYRLEFVIVLLLFKMIQNTLKCHCKKHFMPIISMNLVIKNLQKNKKTIIVYIFIYIFAH